MVGFNSIPIYYRTMSFSKRIATAMLLMPSMAKASATYIHAGGYFGRAQNPFFGNPELSTVYLEDFELPNFTTYPYNYLNTPNARGWNGARSGSTMAGVREDYAPTDPNGGLGYYWTNAVHTLDTDKLPAGIHFDFTPDAQGRLPEYVGAALRGSRILGTNPDFNVILVYDRIGQEVTNGEWLIPKPPTGQAIEDLFINFEGIYVPGGISRILFRDFREVDHLTYGYAIPEPSAGWLAAAGGWLWLRRRRA
jgi:hypothetical protein